MAMFLALILVNPVEAKAYSPMAFTNGVIKWESTAKNSTSTGWKYYLHHWNITITKMLNGQVYQTTVPVYEGDFVTNTVTSVSGGTEHYYMYHSLSADTLERLSGWNLL